MTQSLRSINEVFLQRIGGEGDGEFGVGPETLFGVMDANEDAVPSLHPHSASPLFWEQHSQSSSVSALSAALYAPSRSP
jgi:hypothetical protein